MKDFLKSILNGRGEISAKRVTGAWLIAVASFCITWLTIKEGGTHAVEDLLETALIVAASLLGLTSVTGIFKGWKELKSKDQGSEEENNS